MKIFDLGEFCSDIKVKNTNKNKDPWKLFPWFGLAEWGVG